MLRKIRKKKKLTIRPYARILTMLGDQLIKNERIALIELIKNSYDADASWAKISFCNFGEGYKRNSESKIVIEDSGYGMTSFIIENHWLNPATPEKKLRKKKKDTTPKGRKIQGEKGIGRFSMLKLGRTIRIITRPKGGEDEYVIEYDFSKYDDEFLTEDGVNKELFIDDLSVTKFSRKPKVFVKKKVTLGIKDIDKAEHGTKIEISNLKGSWSEKKVDAVYRDLSKLEPIFSIRRKKKIKRPDVFKVWIYLNNQLQKHQDNYIKKLNNLLDERPIIRIEKGIFNVELLQFEYSLNGNPKVFELNSPKCLGLKIFQDWFGKKGEELKKRNIECGSFGFEFFIFDFRSNATPKYKIDKDDKEILREHRIYLYRDGIRVYPYGERDDDWLKIDIHRGTISAGHFLSNDQVVGQIDITQKGNQKLKDKTNREGLIEEGNATQDLIVLIQTFLRYVRNDLYKQYAEKIESKKSHDIYKKEQIEKDFDELKEVVKENKKARKLIDKTQKRYQAERKYLTQRAELTEELAGVGLSIETASHDIVVTMNRVTHNTNELIKELMAGGKVNKDELLKELESIRGSLSIMEDQLKNIGTLYTSTKKRRKNIRVKTIVEKVERIYRRLLKKESIKFSIKTEKPPLIAKTTDAVLLQLLLNLFDNSVYWLQQINSSNKTIEITLDGHNGQMVFSDNGPGIVDEDLPYIFEPFFSGKGQDGRGLGLYIARQLLERNDYTIEFAELRSDKILEGANFVVSFVSEDK